MSGALSRWGRCAVPRLRKRAFCPRHRVAYLSFTTYGMAVFSVSFKNKLEVLSISVLDEGGGGSITARPRRLSPPVSRPAATGTRPTRAPPPLRANARGRRLRRPRCVAAASQSATPSRRERSPTPRLRTSAALCAGEGVSRRRRRRCCRRLCHSRRHHRRPLLLRLLPLLLCQGRPDCGLLVLPPLPQRSALAAAAGATATAVVAVRVLPPPAARSCCCCCCCCGC